MIFKFGKYKGYELSVVEIIDPGYIRWAKQNAPNLIPKPPKKHSPSGDELNEIQDYASLRNLRHILSANPGNLEDAF